jgi:chaperonin GroES
MQLVPLGDHVVVKREEAPETSTAGILLPDSTREKPRQGRVVSLGEGRLLENGRRGPFQVHEGDRVLFRSYAGTEINHEGTEYLILSEDDILAVLG